MHTTRICRGLLFVMIAVLWSSVLYSQEDFEKFKKAEESKFKQWKDERDKAFADFLQQEWKRFQAFKGDVAFEVPKPDKLPVAEPTKRPEKAPELKAKPEALPEPQATPPVEIPPEPKKETRAELKEEVQTEPVPEPVTTVDPSKNPKMLECKFFELNLPIRYDERLAARLEGPPNSKSISAFWEAMSKSNYEDYLKQVTEYRERMSVNDWGFCELLYRTAAQLYPTSLSERNMFVWFMLLKSGYQAKIGYSGPNVYLLLPSANALYDVAYYSFAGSDRKFYNIMFDSREKPQILELYSYNQNYPGAVRLTNYQVDRAPNIQHDVQTRELRFTHDGTDYNITVKCDRSAVKFYEYYPQTNFEVYFDAKVSPEASSSLVAALKPLVAGKSETEAVDLLLHFVQTAFDYKTDQENFGREKPLFPDETLHYAASDCEDRSILFAFLVRRLLGLEVVGLDYPGHIATAVRFTGNVEGDAVTVNGQKWIVCDPTYVNADHGKCMPQFKNVKPGTIAMKQ